MLDRSAEDSTPIDYGVDIDRVGDPLGTTDIQVTADLGDHPQITSHWNSTSPANAPGWLALNTWAGKRQAETHAKSNPRYTTTSLRASHSRFLPPGGWTFTTFELSATKISRRVRQAALAAGAGGGFSGNSGRVGKVWDMLNEGSDLPELMEAGRWKSIVMPARYIKKQAERS